ncbi:hypothetical protein SAMN04487769_3212 [Burkholderia sp. b14]|nr:hypothetical protein SAMN04487769_3212 [Burkholderia sp. b14]
MRFRRATLVPRWAAASFAGNGHAAMKWPHYDEAAAPRSVRSFSTRGPAAFRLHV